MTLRVPVHSPNLVVAVAEITNPTHPDAPAALLYTEYRRGGAAS